MSKSREELRQAKREAFEAVVSEYEGPLLRYTSRIVMDRDAAQDVVQNTFIKLFRRWKDEMKPSPQVSSWLYRVAHNGAVDYLREENRRRDLHMRHAAESPDFAAANRGDEFKVSEDAHRAVKALQTLSLREQQLVVLKVYEEKSYREIADITGLTVSNVGYILHHAMKKMGDVLREMKEQES